MSLIITDYLLVVHQMMNLIVIHTSFADVISENCTVDEIARIIAETMDKAFAEEINPEKFMETARLNRTELYGEG